MQLRLTLQHDFSLTFNWPNIARTGRFMKRGERGKREFKREEIYTVDTRDSMIQNFCPYFKMLFDKIIVSESQQNFQ